MKLYKCLLFFLPLFLLLSVPVLGSTGLLENVNFTTTNELQNFQVKDRIKCWFNETNYWYCSYVKNSDKILYMELYNPAFTSLGSLDAENCLDSDGCNEADCNLQSWQTTAPNIHCIGIQDDTYEPMAIYNFSIASGSFATIDYNNYNVGGAMYMSIPTVSNKYYSNQIPYISWFKDDAGSNRSPQYTKTNSVGGNSHSGDGSWTIPSTYRLNGACSDSGGCDYQMVGCNNGNEILFILNGTTDRLDALVFDSDRNYLNYVESLIPYSTWDIQKDNFGVWHDSISDTIYLVAVNDSSSDPEMPLIHFASYSCNDASISYIQSKTMNQSFIESTVNSTANIKMQKPFLIKDVNDVFTLFYEFRSGSSYYIKSAQSIGDCSSCSEPIPTGVCNDGYEKYNRTCPTTAFCTNSTFWVATDFCYNEYQKEIGNYTLEYSPYSQEYECLTDLAETPETVSCSFKEDIPDNCLNVSVKITAIPDWYSEGLGCDQGNYTIKVCLPDKSDSCTEATYDCDQLNETLSKTYASYIGGDIATGSSWLEVDELCKCYLTYTDWFPVKLIPVGITEYRLKTNFKVTCQQPYESKWVCDENGNWERFQEIDGTFSDENFCTNGCNDATGRCFGNVNENAGNPLGLMYWVNFILQPNDDQKVIVALIGCFVIGSIAVGLNSKFGKDQNSVDFGISFLIGFGIGFVIFSVIGWIPAWVIGTIIVFGLGGFAISQIRKK